MYTHTYIYIYIKGYETYGTYFKLLLCCILIYPLSTLFTLQYKQYIYKQI